MDHHKTPILLPKKIKHEKNFMDNNPLSTNQTKTRQKQQKKKERNWSQVVIPYTNKSDGDIRIDIMKYCK